MTFDTGTEEREDLAADTNTDVETDLGPDPRQLAQEHYESLIARGYAADDAQAESINMIANAAMRGDKRVIVDADWSPYR
jgi:hypothetical protein